MARIGVWLAIVALAGCSAVRVAEGPAPAGPPLTERAEPPAMLGPTVPVPNSYRQAVMAGTRSETGVPGPESWRNTVSYRIEAELDPATARLRGTQRIVYRNGSPNNLPSVVLNLYQNVFSEGVPRNRFVSTTGGVELRRVAAGGQTLDRVPTNTIPISGDVPDAPAGYSAQGTLARIRLPLPISPGDSAIIEIEWEHTVPPRSTFRTAWEETLGSRVFHVAQWYPQIAMYDDLNGWDATPYLGDGEFYLPYGDFDVSITLPVGFLVGASGELVNAHEVLTAEAQSRLAAALLSDGITRVVTDADIPAENTTQHSIGGQLVWRFAAENVRDFAFATSSGYVWDATRVMVPTDDGGVRAVAIHALYRPDAPNWSDAARFGQHSMGVLNDYLIPYSYSQLTIAEGPVGGMEYPMIMFIGKPSAAPSLYGVIAHEAAHGWFPMMVGMDEAAYAWFDEGLATFLENIAFAEFYEEEDPFRSDRAGYLSVAGSDVEVPMMRHTDLVTPYGARTTAAYSKPAVLLRALEWVVGAETFRTTLNEFTRDWLWGHPTPWDFFSAFEMASGQGLGWFFEPWWFGTEVLDHAIVGVEGAETGRALVTIENRGTIAVPAMLRATTAAGGSISMVISAEAWLDGSPTLTVTLQAADPIESVVLDPQNIFPDIDRSNNVWTQSAAVAAATR